MSGHMGSRAQKTNAAAGVMLSLAAAFSAEAGADNYLHAAPEIRRDIGATGEFLEREAKRYDTHVFLYRCSQLGITPATPPYKTPIEDAKARLISTFPEILDFVSDKKTPDSRKGALGEMIDTMIHPRCQRHYTMGPFQPDPGKRVVFISVPEQFSEGNFDSLSMLPAAFYKADLAMLQPDSVDWMLKHDFYHFIQKLENRACRTKTSGGCDLRSEAGSDLYAVENSLPEKKQRIVDTRAIGALHGSSSDHNTAPFLGTARTWGRYDAYFKGSDEARSAVIGALRHSLLDEAGDPLLTDTMPQELAASLQQCAISYKAELEERIKFDLGDASTYTKEKQIPLCLIFKDARVVPAAAAQINPGAISREGQTYLVDYFAALGREAKPEFYDNEIGDYVRRQIALQNLSPQ